MGDDVISRVERIRRLRRETSERLQYVAQTVRCLVNPDGPEAADYIEMLEAALDRLSPNLEGEK